MPRVANPKLPLNGVFGIIKPSGPTSMWILDRLKSLISDSFLFVDEKELQKQREKSAGGKQVKGRGKFRSKGPKVGQGGTLDPLADGVLVVGVGKGTKQLGKFLDCTKEYRTIGLLGCETDTYDSEGARVRIAPWSHVTREDVEKVLDQFRGDIKQIPPIYSALKMDGMALYEYARANKPLPRPIQPRDAKVLSLELIDWQDSSVSSSGFGHTYTWPTKEAEEDAKQNFQKIKKLIVEAEEQKPEAEMLDGVKNLAETDEGIMETKQDGVPPVFALKMVVSSGTYVRSIVHDIGLALGSAAHVVSLTRTRQGNWALPSSLVEPIGNGSAEAIDGPPIQATDLQSPAVLPESACIPWEIFEKAYEDRQKGNLADSSAAKLGEWVEWEKQVLSHFDENA